MKITKKIHEASLLIEQNLFEQSKKILKSIRLRNPLQLDALYLLAIAEASTKNLNVANEMLTQILKIEPTHYDAIYTKSRVLMDLNEHSEALPYHNLAIQYRPNNFWAYLNRGNTHSALKDFDSALTDYNKTIELNDLLPEAFCNKANVLYELGLLEASLTAYRKAIDLKSDYPEAWYGQGNALLKLNRADEAIDSYKRAIDLNPTYAEAWNQIGNAQSGLNFHHDALFSFEQAIVVNPGYAGAWYNRGNALRHLKYQEEALESYDRALAIKPDYPEAWLNRGNTLSDLKQHDEALLSYDQALKNNPELPYALGNRIQAQMKICEWSGFEVYLKNLEEKIIRNEKASHPFYVLGLFDSPELQKISAETYAKDKAKPLGLLGPLNPPRNAKRIRIGYFSMDFREHPVSSLIAELFELHDREQFEVYGFSFGPNTQDPIRNRLEKSFDKFFDVENHDALGIAALARQLEINIAVDLGGYTRDSRPKIFAERAAPIQINYLGYPGTMGGTNYEYLIADESLIPENFQTTFAEKIIYLPHCYQANDSKRRISSHSFSRADLGLPAEKFIFCCFNNSWKITPEIFDCWMRILGASQNSVLWLFSDNELASTNLRNEAVKRGISSERLVFAEPKPLEEHLARYRMADLFIDTLPYNAHTTASDALWAGLPILTLRGKAFAGRVASSLLRNIGLSELVTETLDEYQSLAIELAFNPEKLHEIRGKLNNNRLTMPLFNTPLFTQKIEAAYKQIYEMYRIGAKPENIFIQ